MATGVLRGVTLLGWIVWAAAAAASEKASLPEAVRVRVRTEKFAPVASVATLPESARLGLAALFRRAQLEMADPGGEFQATDLVMKPNLPARRLSVAGCSPEHCIVYYERGGFARTWTVVILQIQKSPAELVWGGSAPRGLGDLAAVQKALLAGRVDGRTSRW